MATMSPGQITVTEAKGAAKTLRRAAVRCLAVLAARLRDAVERAPGRLAALLMRDVAERDDADEALLAVDHRQPPHLGLAHVARDVVELLVFEAVEDLRRHHVAD